MRVKRVVGWAGALLSVGLTAVVVPIVVSEPLTEAAPALLGHIPFLGMALVGAVLADRRPSNATGWFLLVAGFLSVLNGTALEYATNAPATPFADLAAWVAFWVWLPSTALLGAVLAVFPSGVAVNRFWRWYVRAAVLTGPVVAIASVSALGGPREQLLGGPSNATFPGSAFVRFLATWPIALFLPLGFVALVIRFVRARGVERVQMKWFVLGAGVLAMSTFVMVGGALILGIEDPIAHPVGYLSLGVGTLAIPVSAGVAILRYRLYDIDRLISRTFSYAIVTALLGSTFAVLVVVPAQFLGTASTPDYAIAGATLIVAALIRPVRRRVQSAVDHRFNRRRYQAEHTIDAFQSRLRAQIDIDALSAELRDVVHRTMQPKSVSLWVRS